MATSPTAPYAPFNIELLEYNEPAGDVTGMASVDQSLLIPFTDHESTNWTFIITREQAMAFFDLVPSSELEAEKQRCFDRITRIGQS